MDSKFNYMLLNRLQADCEYYINNYAELGANRAKALWAGEEQAHIDKMRELYDLLPVKPEWCTREQINHYAQKLNVK